MRLGSVGQRIHTNLTLPPLSLGLKKSNLSLLALSIHHLSTEVGSIRVLGILRQPMKEQSEERVVTMTNVSLHPCLSTAVYRTGSSQPRPFF